MTDRKTPADPNRARGSEPTRYERVKQILDQANQGSKSDYGGQGEFWNLPYEQLLTVEVVGVRMIAPPSWEMTGVGPRSAPVASEPPEEAPSEAGTAGATGEGGGDAKAGGSCCGGGSAPPSPAGSGPDPGRGDRSGLVKALRGETPFDHDPYPPFMWGVDVRVTSSNIEFIRSWIDDGCPPTDDAPPPDPDPAHEPWEEVCGPVEQGGAPGSSPVYLAPLGGVQPHGSANAFHHAAGNPKVRKNAEALNEGEICRLRYAVGKLQELNQYPADNRSFNAWAEIHGDHCQHGWEQFLPWHRAYLYRFEKAIQAVVPDVTLPYWDWPMPRYNDGMVPSGERNGRQFQSGIVPTPLRCFVDRRALDNLKRRISTKTWQALDQEVNDRGTDPTKLFNSTWELFYLSGLDRADYEADAVAVVPELQRANPLWHPLRYPGMFYQAQTSGQPLWKDGVPVLAYDRAMKGTFHHHYPTADELRAILALDTWHDFGGGHFANESFGVLSQNPHNTGHIWSGGANPFWQNDPSDPNEPQWGDMFVDLTAFFDPIAYHHHSNVDRMWADWQKLHPGVNPDDLTANMNPFNLTVDQLLSTTKLGYVYAADSVVWPVDPDHEVSQLHTEPAPVHPVALDEPSRAEVWVHNAARSVSSYWVRVFINQPEADLSTPTEGNDHYVGYFGRFGHGPCVGGPGHCEPRRSLLPFETPTRDHNAPQTYRLDATEVVRRLIEEGATDFHVNLVVTHGHGTVPEGLKLEGIELRLYG